ncbi:hypothetical protein EW146_g7005 [Bondarzewia mesenterica]|uniref:Uncharacterized protein n=1 Tax=Bondarzewia mesenterica TaxID=1095465 RepID=A0A4S4LSP8_9AGAM|nr:hypothetical protein EW146_g7005 [Bondarzewia mesenterica]
MVRTFISHDAHETVETKIRLIRLHRLLSALVSSVLVFDQEWLLSIRLTHLWWIPFSTSMALKIDVAELAGLVAEGILYGIYLVLFIFSVYLLVARRNRGERLRYPMIVTAILMFLLVTAQIVADTWNLFIAFFHNDTRAERIGFLEDVSQDLFAVKHNVLNFMLLVGDLFVCYRCFIIWGRNPWVVVLPLALSAGSLACGIQVTWATQNLASTTVKAQSSWITALFTLSLCANAISTALLAFKIWQVDRAAKRLMAGSGSTLLPILGIVVESGVMNAAYLLAYTITLVTGTEALETMAEMVRPCT